MEIGPGGDVLAGMRRRERVWKGEPQDPQEKESKGRDRDVYEVCREDSTGGAAKRSRGL